MKDNALLFNAVFITVLVDCGECQSVMLGVQATALKPFPPALMRRQPAMA